MAALVTLSEDGPLGPAGTRVWMDDPQPAKAEEPKAAPRKAPAKKSAGKS